MKQAEEILQILKANFPESNLELKTDQPTEPILIASPLEIDKLSLFLRDSSELLFDSLMNLSGVDEIKANLLSADLYPWYGSAAIPEYLNTDNKIWKIKP